MLVPRYAKDPAVCLRLHSTHPSPLRIIPLQLGHLQLHASHPPRASRRWIALRALGRPVPIPAHRSAH